MHVCRDLDVHFFSKVIFKEMESDYLEIKCMNVN